MTPILLGNMISYGTYFFWYELIKKELGIEPTKFL